MEWILIGGLVWWWLSRRRRNARQRSAQEPTISSRGVALTYATPVAVAEGYGYWLAQGRLVRAPQVNGSIDLDQVEDADPLLLDDLPPALALEIIEILEEAQRALEQPRSKTEGD